MKREELKKLGIEDDEVLDNIMALHGKDIEKHKSELESTREELESLRSQLAEASKTIDSFKAMKPDELQKAAEEWRSKYEAAQAEAQAKLDELKYEHALERSLLAAKAKNVKAVKALLDTSGLKVRDDGTIEGLAEQLEKVKAENEFLLESEEPEPKIVLGGKGKSVIGDASVIAARRAAGLPEEKE